MVKNVKKSPGINEKVVDLDGYPLPKSKAYKVLKASECYWKIDPKKLGFKTTDEVKPLKAIVGQPRASAALKLGAQIRGCGYNIFVTGISATGRSTAVKNILEAFHLKNLEKRDHCYVYNFKVTEQPRLLTFPSGKGSMFKREMGRLIDNLKKTIPPAFEDEAVINEQRELTEKYAQKEAELFQKLEKKVNKGGFALVQVQMGPYTRPDVFPVIDGEPVPPNQVGSKIEEGKFPKDRIEELYKKYQAFKAELRSVMKQSRALHREHQEKMEAIERAVISELLKDYCSDLVEKFQTEAVEEYMCECRDYIIEHPGIFKAEESEGEQGPPMNPMAMSLEDLSQIDPLRMFQVNVVHDSTLQDKVPIIIEHHPNYNNLFGTIEREWRYGGFSSTDFTQIRSGSLLNADGGYLVLNAVDVLQDPITWRTLMRTLKTGKLQIQGIDSILSLSPATMKPDPIDIDVTVILIGDSYMYQLLNFYEEDFARTFKVRADFDNLMPNGRKEIGYYASLVRKMTDNESTFPFTAEAVARLAEQGARLGGRGGKLTARLGEIADIIREATHYAKIEGAVVITPKFLEKALSEAEYRQDLIREKIDEAIKDEVLVIQTSGEVVGQINGLAVYDLGAYAFGRPQRITCEISMGDSGVINIEREAKLSGRIHDKGILILEGHLRHQYGKDWPISMSASICFEQSYAQVEGDSASVAEALVLLSELSGVPLRQDLAVTGSMNQKGEVQAIGGINEKIEGFHRICCQNGLTGTQGVVIPHINTAELMLSKEVLDSIAKGKFSIYPVKTLDQAIEVFTGVAAGRRLKNGGWTKGSIHDRVFMTLCDFYWRTKEPGGIEGDWDAPAYDKPKPSRPRLPRDKKDGGSDPNDPRDQGKKGKK